METERLIIDQIKETDKEVHTPIIKNEEKEG